MRLAGFHHVAIQVHALEPMRAFYTDVLGMREVARHHSSEGLLRSIWMGFTGGFLALETVPEPPGVEAFRNGRPGLFLVALRIAPEDRPVVRAALAERGVALVHETRWTLYVRDPEGNRVGLSHHPHPAPGVR